MEIERESFESFWLRTNEEWKIILEDEDAIVFILSGEFENEKKILGFSHNSINGNNGLKEGQYIRIAVNPQYKRTGLATKLTEKAFEFFRRNNVRKIYLSTVKDNEQLNIMYKNWGFHYFDSDTIMGKKMGEIRGK
jgi:ribosomal protein S18 acetylase RimI-like enzyme